MVLDRFSPILHLVQSIRDEAHRFAVTFHRSRRNARQLTSRAGCHSGRRREDRAQAVEAIRQLGAGASRDRGAVGRGGGPRGGAEGEGASGRIGAGLRNPDSVISPMIQHRLRDLGVVRYMRVTGSISDGFPWDKETSGA